MGPRSKNLWGVILSGGEGTRLQQFIRSMYGIVRPKQYCSIVGTRSMLQHTIDRVRSLVDPRKMLAVVNHAHLEYVQQQINDHLPLTILVQPCSRETATGILLPLLHIYHRKPDAIVGIFPSDHFVLEEAKFMEYVEQGFIFAAKHTSSIVLLGISPTRAEPGYGWIERDGSVAYPQNSRIHRIMRFWEKPDRTMAEKLFAKGCLWNTFVMIGAVSAFLSHFREMIPETFHQFNAIMRLSQAKERETRFNRLYPSLPSLNFSREILERSPGNLSVLEVSGIYWSDWGDASRVLRDVERLHLKLHQQAVLQ
jgi:mannose-1-phosphate guanylyltransferase